MLITGITSRVFPMVGISSTLKGAFANPAFSRLKSANPRPLAGKKVRDVAPLLYSLKDADRDLLRLLLMTSAARVQCRSDVDGSWSRPTSFLRDRRGFPVSSVDFFGPPSPTSGFGLRRSCELSYARVSQSGFYSAYVRRLRCEIYLTTQV